MDRGGRELHEVGVGLLPCRYAALQQAIAKHHDCSHRRFGGWFKQHFPGARGDLVQQEYFNFAPRPGFVTPQPCRYDPGVVDDHDIASLQVSANMAKDIVGNLLSGPIHHQQARLIAPSRWLLGNQLWG
jgi:hypothetical protein